MYALVVDKTTPSALRLARAPRPVAKPNQILVEVTHTSLNWGELNHARQGAENGQVLGWDAAGIVRAAAEDGSGPQVGARVVTFGWDGGAWAQLRAVDTADVAVVPDGIDLADAAALPVAGVSALRALRAGGPLLGRRVLITGASGGVGRFAVQLAALGGAHVIACVGSEKRGAGLAELGAHEVVVGLDTVKEPVDVVLDSVGGPMLVAAYERLAVGGNLQSIGWTSREPAVFEMYATVGPAKTLTSFMMGAGLNADLSTLLTLLGEGRLSVEIGWRGSWTQADEAIDALFGRRVAGKAVLDVEPLGSGDDAAE